MLALVLLLAACGAPAAPEGMVIQRQQIDQLTIELALPARPLVSSEQPAIVTLADARGPVDGAEVWLELIMPSMDMSTNQPDAIGQQAGRYRSTVLFTMVGAWNLDVHAVVAGQEYVARFYTETH